MTSETNVLEIDVCGDEDAIGNSCTVEAGDYFICISSDPYEMAQMHVSVARKLLEVLPQSIAHVEASERYR